MLPKIHAENVEILKISDVKINPLNTRHHGEQSIETLKYSLQRFGQRKAIVVRKSDMVASSGNGILQAAKELGWRVIAATVVDETNTDALAYEIMDNRSAEKSEWDEDMLPQQLQALSDDGIDIDDTGFSEDELNDMMDSQALPIEEDDVPEHASAEVNVEPGSVWHLGRHRLICGDCTDERVSDKLFGAELVNIVITDPPYGVSVASKNTHLNKSFGGERIEKPISGDHKNATELGEFLAKVFHIIRGKLADTNSYYIFSPPGDIGPVFQAALMDAGLPWRHILIWVKNNSVLSRCDYHYQHEPILYGWTKRHKFYGNGEFKSSVWSVDRPMKNDLHPTMKPVRLIVNALLNSSQKNDICHDPFLGSGSTLIACEQTDRICYGCEIDPAYCQVIIDRWEKLTGQVASLSDAPHDQKGHSQGKMSELLS